MIVWRRWYWRGWETVLFLKTRLEWIGLSAQKTLPRSANECIPFLLAHSISELSSFLSDGAFQRTIQWCRQSLEAIRSEGKVADWLNDHEQWCCWTWWWGQAQILRRWFLSGRRLFKCTCWCWLQESTRSWVSADHTDKETEAVARHRWTLGGWGPRTCFILLK